MAVAAAVWSLGGCPGPHPDDPRPYNFVVIVADDLGARELPAYGNTTHRTPHLDRLAAEGMRFETAYATPICTASRVMILTGRYGFRTGWFGLMGHSFTPKPGSPRHDLGASETTFSDLLRARGYETALAGKWQLPGSPDSRVNDCGFDEYCIWAWKHDLPDRGPRPRAFEGRRKNKTSRYWQPGVIENGSVLDTNPDDYGPDIYTTFLIEFIQRNRHRPFLVYYPMALVHRPWGPTPDPRGSARRSPPGLSSNIEYMDHLVGRIVRAVDRLGLTERTLIFFTADNGTAGAGKGFLTEDGVRVPLIVYGPGTVEAGIVSSRLVDLSDLLPTIAELADAPLPEDRRIDGVSFASTLRGETGRTREWIFSYLEDRRLLRTRRWLLENDSPDHFGDFFDCGDARDRDACVRVGDATDPEVADARRRFEEILTDLPGPAGLADLIRPGDVREARGPSD